MGGPSKNSAYISCQMTIDQRVALDQAAKEAGMNRNAFIKAFIELCRAGKNPFKPKA